MKIYIKLLIIVLFFVCLPTMVQAAYMCPDGSYVSNGPCTSCPDGSYIGGGAMCELAPNGSYIPSNRNTLSTHILPNVPYINPNVNGEGFTSGLKNIRQIEEINLMREQRRAIEEQRFEKEIQTSEEEKQKIRAIEEQQFNRNRLKLTAYLDKAVPDWRQIDSDPDFIGWLNENGAMRLYKDAVKNEDRWETAQFFNDYKASLQSHSNENRPRCYDKCKIMYESKQLKSGMDIKKCMSVICK